MLQQKLSQYKHVIWDWNGTLVEDLDLVYTTLSEQLRLDGKPPITLETYRDTFCFPIKTFYKSLGYTLNDQEFHEKAQWFNERYNSQIHKTQLFNGVPAVLKEIKMSGRTQSVLSAAEQNNLEFALNHFGVSEYFDNICGLGDVYGRSKVARGRDLLAQCSQHKPEKTVLIGDTDHDFEVAQKLGIEVLLIADGHQSYSRMKDLHKNVLPSRYSKLN